MNHKYDLLYKDKEIVGLDIGATSIKVAQLKMKKGKIFLKGCGLKPLEENPFNPEGALKDPKETAEKVKELIKKDLKWGKITAKRVNLSIPESKIFTRVMELPPLGEKELKEAVNWEVDQYIPTPLKELYVDWEIIGITKKGKTVLSQILVVAVPKKIVDSYLEMVYAVGLEPFNVEMNLAAVTRAMVSNKAKDEAILVLDIGGQTTSIAVFDRAIRITGSILFGGDNVSQINENNSVSGPAETLDAEIKKLIEYYEDKGDQKKITKILICGGAAYTPTLLDGIAKKTGLQVEVGNPWTNISTYPLKPLPKKDAPRYANAIGLALKGFTNE